MSIFYRDRTILAKVEVTEGTDIVPTGSANAILCGNITITPLGGSTVDRDVTFASFGALPKVHVNKMITAAFDVELAGSGTAGDAPLYGPLLRACGMAETIVADTKVEYAPVSSGQESVTIYSNESGTLHALVGARGTVSFKFPKDSFPIMSFTFTGRWTNPSSQALPDIDVSAWPVPLSVGKVNTPTFTLDTTTLVLEDLQIDLGNTVVHRDRPNAEYVALTDRQMAGSMVFEAIPLTTKDFFAKAYNNITMVRQIIHGVTAGSIVQLDEPAVQLLQPSYSNVDGVRCLTMNTVSARGDTDDSDILITVK